MNKKYLAITFASTLACLSIGTACQGQSKTTTTKQAGENSQKQSIATLTDSLVLESITKSEDEATKDNEELIRFRRSLKLYYPKGDEKALRLLIDIALIETEGIETMSLEEVKALYSDGDSSLQELDSAPLPRLPEGKHPKEILLYEDITGTAIAENEDYYTISITNDSDQGGGPLFSNRTHLASINKATGKELREEDIFLSSYLKPVTKLLLAGVYAKIDTIAQSSAERLEYRSHIRVEDVVPDGNFYFTNQGITWHFNPYDIGPYFLGSFTIEIPWSELRPYLKEAFAKYAK